MILTRRFSSSTFYVILLLGAVGLLLLALGSAQLLGTGPSQVPIFSQNGTIIGNVPSPRHLILEEGLGGVIVGLVFITTAALLYFRAPVSVRLSSTRFCTKCGTPLEPFLSFCAHCGQTTEAQ